MSDIVEDSAAYCKNDTIFFRTRDGLVTRFVIVKCSVCQITNQKNSYHFMIISCYAEILVAVLRKDNVSFHHLSANSRLFHFFKWP